MIYKEPICSKCKWRIFDRPGAYCKAYPDGKGIPDEILVGDNDHKSVITGQEGDFVYTPIKDVHLH